MTRMYLIDGIQVTKKVWERRKIWGEHAGARFEVVEVRRPVARRGA